MVGAILFTPTNAASQEAMAGSAQRVVVARARAQREAAVQYCLEYLGSEHPYFELERSTRSVVQFEGLRTESTPCVAYVPITLGGHPGIVVDLPPEVYELVRVVVHLAHCLYAECGGGLRHPLRVLTHDLNLGLRHGEAKRRSHDHDHPHHLPQLNKWWTPPRKSGGNRLNPFRETKLSVTSRDRAIFILPLQLTTSRIGNPTRLIHTLLCI